MAAEPCGRPAGPAWWATGSVGWTFWGVTEAGMLRGGSLG